MQMLRVGQQSRTHFHMSALPLRNKPRLKEIRIQLERRAEYHYVTVSVKEMVRAVDLRNESEIMTHMS